MRGDFINIWDVCSGFSLPERKLIYAGNPSDEIWTTKAGKRLTVGSMTDAHIINCYDMVRQGRLLDEYWLAVFEAELAKRDIEI